MSILNCKKFTMFSSRIESGATATEYALVITTIAFVLVGALTFMGGQIEFIWTELSDVLDGV